MSTLYGKVLNVQKDIDIKGQNKTYKGYRLVLQTPEGEIRPIEKTMQSLKFNPSVDTALDEIKAGDDITVSMAKNDKGFWDVKAIQKGEFSEQLATPPQAPVASGRQSNTGYAAPARTGNTYETPEERKLKQRLIVRQAALNQALEYMKDSEGDLTQVRETAEVFEEWVYRGLE